MFVRFPQTSNRAFVLLLALLPASTLLSACSNSQSIAAPPARDDSPVQTDSLAYHLRRLPSEYRADVTATFINRSASPVYFARCNRQSTTPMFGVRRTGPDSTAKLFSGFAWACVGGVPTGEIPVGGSVTVRVPVGSVDQHAMQPPLKPEDLVGLMRVELSLCKKYSADSDYCDPSPQAQRSSNAFYVSY
jgi:hypothetical protein